MISWKRLLAASIVPSLLVAGAVQAADVPATPAVRASEDSTAQPKTFVQFVGYGSGNGKLGMNRNKALGGSNNAFRRPAPRVGSVGPIKSPPAGKVVIKRK